MLFCLLTFEGEGSPIQRFCGSARGPVSGASSGAAGNTTTTSFWLFLRFQPSLLLLRLEFPGTGG